MLVRAKRVERRYATQGISRPALDQASFEIREGDRIAVTGPSGSGKSTLLGVIAGLETPSSGEIAWPEVGPHAVLRPDHVAMVFQAGALLPMLTAIENVALPLALSAGAFERALDPQAILDRLGIGDLAGRLMDDLSGGQAQRVAVARALVTRPRVMLADEPTGQLDRATGLRLIDDILALSAETDTALVIATHDAGVAALLDVSWTMSKGILAVEGTGARAA